MAYVFAFSPFVLCGGFVISILCGAFENRAQVNYCFRSKRFLAVIAVVFILNICAAVALMLGLKNWLPNASRIAQIVLIKNRAISEYTLENLGVIFPEILNDKNKQCYRSALSNYVEDDWNKSFNTGMWQREEPFCKNNPAICDGKQDDYFEAIRDKVNPFHLFLGDLKAIEYFEGTNWITAAESYKKLRQFNRQPDSKGVVPPPPDEQMLTNYHKYLMNCLTLEPLPWAAPNGQLLKSEATFCIGICQ